MLLEMACGHGLVRRKHHCARFSQIYCSGYKACLVPRRSRLRATGPNHQCLLGRPNGHSKFQQVSVSNSDQSLAAAGTSALADLTFGRYPRTHGWMGCKVLGKRYHFRSIGSDFCVWDSAAWRSSRSERSRHYRGKLAASLPNPTPRHGQPTPALDPPWHSPYTPFVRGVLAHRTRILLARDVC
jgi:hypothetical protein